MYCIDSLIHSIPEVLSRQYAIITSSLLKEKLHLVHLLIKISASSE